MRVIKHLFIVLVGVLFIWSCQKEVSLESANGSNGQATGSIRDTSNNCFPIIVNGTYLQDSTLTDSNYVVVQANIVTAGSYLIFSDVVNGMSFRDSGFITTTGLQTFKLKGKGKPALTGLNDFTVSFGGSLCSFSVTVGTSASAAVYTLGSTAGACTSANIQGAYVSGTPLSTTNKVTLNVTVSTPGSYSISTTTVNGMTFTSNGVFTATGAQIVTLQASGTPTTTGNNTIPVAAGGSTCSFVVNVLPAGAQAVFSLGATAGACTTANVQGTYAVNTALTTTNKVDVTVNVTTIGAYSITTTSTSGMTFGASGTFTTTGVQTVTLNGTGTPTTAGSNAIQVNGGGTTCTFNITVNASGSTNPNLSDSAWSFFQGTSFFRGKVDSAGTETVPGFGLGLEIYGASTNVPGDSLYLGILFTSGTIQPGTYTTGLVGAFYYYNATTDKYSADPGTPGAITSITVTSYDAATRLLVGTFAGTAKTATGSIVPITLGKFRVRVN